MTPRPNLLLLILCLFLPFAAAGQEPLFRTGVVELYAAPAFPPPPQREPRLTFRAQIYRSDTLFPEGILIQAPIPEGEAILHRFGSPQVLALSLASLGVPRDLILADAEGRITEILTAGAHGPTLVSQGQAAMVMQLNGGAAKTYGIVAGEMLGWR